MKIQVLCQEPVAGAHILVLLCPINCILYSEGKVQSWTFVNSICMQECNGGGGQEYGQELKGLSFPVRSQVPLEPFSNELGLNSVFIMELQLC